MWTEERVALLRRLWAEGLSASQIAKQLGGVTRNAVIGKVRRLGLTGRLRVHPVNHNKVRGARERSIRFVPNKVLTPSKRELLHAEQKLAAALPPLDPAAYLSDMREGQCRFITGDPLNGGGVCGRATPVGAWCIQHAKLVYQPSSPKARVRSVEGDEMRRQARREAWAATL